MSPPAAEQTIRDASGRLAQCTIRDRHEVQRRLRRARQRLRRGQPVDRMLGDVDQMIERSARLVRQRRQAIPTVTYPDDLPVANRREAIMAAIREHPVVVVCGATGSGKTTQLPKMCLELGRGVHGMIGHTQPRRLAARAVATRVAEELDQPLGQAVGYKMRFADQTAAQTRVKVMTDGILLAELASDRDLHQYDTIILDEAHERSLNIDFLLGYLKQLLGRRSDLKLIITSATIDPQRFADHFDGAPVIDVEGRTYPVEVRYRPLEGEADDPAPDMAGAIGEALHELAGEDRGDVLVFLPGERDIREVAEALGGERSLEADVLPLYARLPEDKQRRIFHPSGGRRRVVLATNVAETSLTVPGIRHVIDSGLARISRYAARSKSQRLPIEAISQASADQRKGRCGRVAPGVCIRLYDADDFNQRPAFTEPEIQRTDLASVILRMEALGLGEPASFPFMDPPAGRLIRDGYQTLIELGAIDDRGRLTRIGRQLSQMPVDPRIGRMIVAGRQEHCLREVLVIASALTIADPRVRPAEAPDTADAAHARWFTGDSDFLAFNRLWLWYRHVKQQASRNQLRRACQQNYLAYPRMRDWESLHSQLRDAAAEQRMHLNAEPADADAVHRALLAGLLSNVGYREQKYAYTGAHGRRFAIFPGSSLFGVRPRWLMAGELIETTKLYAHVNAPIQPQWIEPLAEHLVNRHHANPRWDVESQRVIADQRVSLFGLIIVPRRTVHLGNVDQVAARELFIHHGLVEGTARTDLPFYRHNQQLVDQIERLEAKQRKADLLVEERARFDFYDRALPRTVCNTAELETWWKQADDAQRQKLFMSREALLERSADHITAELYPDRMQASGQGLDLEYVAEPGHEQDGVTVTVPLGTLAGLTEDRLEWLVPGLLREKVTMLLRSLPKAQRKRFVPIPNYVEKLLPWLNDFRELPLPEALSRCIAQHASIDIPPDAWSTDELPEHLRMNIAVVDEQGKTLATGRDLPALRARLGDQTRQIIRSAASDQWQRDGINTWDFGAIPRGVTLEGRGMAVHGYPGVVDRGQSVALRVFDSQAEAEAQTRRGVRRLFALAVASELAFIEYDWPHLDRMALQFAPLGDRAALVRQMADAAVDRTFIDGQPAVRDADAFADRLHERGGQLQATADQVHALVSRLLDAYQAAALALEQAPAAWGDAVDDARQQMRRLLGEGFISRTPWPWLVHLPRYLQAIERRLEKIRDGRLSQDRQRMAEFAPFARALEQAGCTGPRDADPHREQFRWMCEELRVSLFAQELGTAVKVSPKRLRQQARKAGIVVE
mgnify:CR=1 FL=1